MQAYAQSISTIWIAVTPILGVGLILGTYLPIMTMHGGRLTQCAVMFVKGYTLKRNIIKGGKQPQDDVEATAGEKSIQDRDDNDTNDINDEDVKRTSEANDGATIDAAENPEITSEKKILNDD